MGNNRMPAIAWLKMTDYTHGWLQWELGGSMRVKDRCAICIQHLPGARSILRMESDDTPVRGAVGNAMSARWKNCIDAGLEIDADAIRTEYGLTPETVDLFVPIECPKVCTTRDGVLRPWTLDVSFGQKQATALQRFLRQAFWDAVADFDRSYAGRMNGRKYAAVDMIEAFCAQTGTPDIHVDALRREWQRRVKRSAPQGCA